SAGTWDLVNRRDQPLAAIPISSGTAWKHTKWTMNGKAYTPEARAGLNIFRPGKPLAPGDHVTIGWSFDAQVPGGVSKNGAGRMEFILPSSVVLTGFSSVNMAPYLGYIPDVGVEEDKNKPDPKEYPDDFYVGNTP